MNDKPEVVRVYLVRHYSHVYRARKVDEQGRYGYYELLSIYKKHDNTSVGVSMRGNIYLNKRSMINYSGEIVKKEMKLVQYIDEPIVEPNEGTTSDLIIGVSFVILIVLIILFSIIY